MLTIKVFIAQKWIPASAGMTANTKDKSIVTPAKAGVHPSNGVDAKHFRYN